MTKQPNPIAALNDAFRHTSTGGIVLITPGVQSLGPILPDWLRVSQIGQRIRAFEEFTPDNDPWGEHDMGVFDFAGQRIMWKIEYFDAAMEFGSENPADPNVTMRVLTIMLADEYEDKPRKPQDGVAK